MEQRDDSILSVSSPIVTPSNPQLTVGCRRLRLRHRLHDLFIFIRLFFKSVIVVCGICLCVIIVSTLPVDFFLSHRLLRSPNERLRLGLERWRLLLHIQVCTDGCLKH